MATCIVCPTTDKYRRQTNHFTSALDLAIEAGTLSLLHTCRLSRLIAIEELRKLLDMDGTDFKLERVFRFLGRESYASRAGIEKRPWAGKER